MQNVLQTLLHSHSEDYMYHMFAPFLSTPAQCWILTMQLQ